MTQRLRVALLAALAAALGCPARAPSAPGASAAAPDSAGSAGASSVSAEQATPAPLGSAAQPRPIALSAGPEPLRRVWAGFDYPRAVALSPAGTLYVVDKSGWLRAFRADGAPLAAAPLEDWAQGTPSALAWPPGGLLLVANSHYGEVLLYDPELRLVRRFGQHGHAPGRFLLLTGIAASAAGQIYVSDQGDDVARVQVFEPDGRFLRSFGRFGSRPGELKRPMGLAVAGERVAVADSLNHRIQVFDLEGTWRAAWGRLGEAPGDLKYPYAVSFGPGDELWVADFGNHRLQAFDSRGSYRRGYGGPGRELGTLRYPWCVLVGAGRLFVTDGGNDRVYELDPASLGSD